MSLYIFHRVLIGASILFDAFFSMWCWQTYQKTEDSTYIAMLTVSSLLVVGFIVYLIYFNRKTRRLQHAIDVACEKCGYDLRGTIRAGKDVCPECGHQVSDLVKREYELNAQA